MFHARFNPTQVRLRRRRRFFLSARRSRFNPTQVRLRRLLADIVSWAGGCFNPTQVRLRPFSTILLLMLTLVSIPHRYDYDLTQLSHIGDEKTFQSHTGTITTLERFRKYERAQTFQSHTGTITTRKPSENPASRKLVSIPHRYDYDSGLPLWFADLCLFQSHTGTITTYADLLNRTAESGFNPTQVRLRPREKELNERKLARFNPTQVRLRQIQEAIFLRV